MSNILKSLMIIIFFASAFSADACDKSPKSGLCYKDDGGPGEYKCEKNPITGCYYCHCTSL